MVEVEDSAGAELAAVPLRFNLEREYNDGEDVLLVELSFNVIFASLFSKVFVNQAVCCCSIELSDNATDVCCCCCCCC